MCVIKTAVRKVQTDRSIMLRSSA